MLGSTDGFCASLGKESWALFLQHLCPRNLKEERETEECYQCLVKVRTHLDLGCKKLYWDIQCVQRGREKNLPSFLEKRRANFKSSLWKWWIMFGNRSLFLCRKALLNGLCC